MAAGGGAPTSHLLLAIATLVSLTLTTATPDFFVHARTAAIATITTDTQTISADEVNSRIVSNIWKRMDSEFGKVVYNVDGRQYQHKLLWDALVWSATEPANPYVDWQTSASGAGGCNLDGSEFNDAECAIKGGSFLVRGVNEDSPKLALLMFQVKGEGNTNKVWPSNILQDMANAADTAFHAHLQTAKGSLRGAAALIGLHVAQVENGAGEVVGSPRAVFICAMGPTVDLRTKLPSVDLGMGLSGGSLLFFPFYAPLAGNNGDVPFRLGVMPA